MKQIFYGVLGLGLLTAVTGCPNSPTGGVVSSNPAKDESFSVEKVPLPTTVKQGGADDVTIALKRGKDFKESVKLTAEKPDKVKVEFTPPTVKGSDEPRSVMKITVDKDAVIGDHTITVKATPDKGTATTIEVKIKVEK